MDTPDVTTQMNALTDAERSYVARWLALADPRMATEALHALATFRRDDPDHARLIFGPEVTR